LRVRERFVKEKKQYQRVLRERERERERTSAREFVICRSIARRRKTPAALSAAAPQRELREANEDGIERKDGMHDTEQSSWRNKSLVNVYQRTRVWFRFRLCLSRLQLRLRRVHMQSAAFRLCLCLCRSLVIGDFDPCDACV